MTATSDGTRSSTRVRGIGRQGRAQHGHHEHRHGRRARHDGADRDAPGDDRRRARRAARAPRASFPVAGRLLDRGASTFAGPRRSRRVARDREPDAIQHVPGNLRRPGDARQRHPAFTRTSSTSAPPRPTAAPKRSQEGTVSFTARDHDGVPGGRRFAPTIGDWSSATTSGTTSGVVTPRDDRAGGRERRARITRRSRPPTPRRRRSGATPAA